VSPIGLLRNAARPRLGLLLWSLGFASTGIMVVEPSLPVALRNPALALCTAAVECTVAVALLCSSFLHFSFQGRMPDALVASGFGALTLASVWVRLVGLITGFAVVQPARATVILLLAEGVAVGLFLTALVNPGRVVAQSRRAVVGPGIAATVWVTTAAAAVWASGALPQRIGLTDAPVQAQLSEAIVVSSALPDQPPWLVLLNCTYALLMLGAAIGYARTQRGLGKERKIGATPLGLLSLSEFSAVLFPQVAVQYVSTGDVLRLAAYLSALAESVRRLWVGHAEHAARMERQRLSRELHDGLAQHLALLQLRLSHAAALEANPEARARDLAVGRLLTESALIEARQSITLLRHDSLSWDQFTRELTQFVAEFAANHDLEIRIETEPLANDTPVVGVEFEREVVRMLHEIFSNAVRHGRATRIDVTLAHGPDACELTVIDNGRGFEPANSMARHGVGLNSLTERLQRRGGRLSIESRPGLGAAIRLWFPYLAPEAAF
jgi:signal transduction histidine kinase